MRTVAAAPSAPALLATVFVIGTCGLVYELLAGTLASYVLGDSVTQFSTVIGVYLAAMGVGAWLSGWVKNVAATFVEVEIAVSLIGGCSAAILFLSFSRLSWFGLVLYGLVFLIGVLVGLEIPLLMRILKDRYALEALVARVLTFDYLGALVASLAFPLFLVPKLGLVRGSFLVGLLNALVGVWCIYLLRGAFRRTATVYLLSVQAALAVLVLGAGLVNSEHFVTLSEERLYADPVIHAETTPYQRIVVTKGKAGFQLFLNGNLQFSSFDEHRYHETLVHPGFAARPRARRILVLGGGDGLGLREVLGYPSVESVLLVDLDPSITRLAEEHPLFRGQNEGALKDPRVKVINQDAMIWLRSPGAKRGGAFDLVFVDFPDPNTFALGKLYTSRFYRALKRVMHKDAVGVLQATSPLYARKSFWCIDSTLREAGMGAIPFHASVPSFGEWGYFLFGPVHLKAPTALTPSMRRRRFMSDSVLRASFIFPPDMARPDPAPPVNRLDNQWLVTTYEEEWSRWQ